MLESEKNQVNELYQNLGKLFYAMAMADHSVHMKEMEKLNEVVRDHWLEVDDMEPILLFKLFLFLIGYWNIKKTVKRFTRSLKHSMWSIKFCSPQKSNIWPCPLQER